MWKVFNNGHQTSPTSTVRHHFEREHLHVWQSECHRLNVPQKAKKSPTGRVPGSSVQEFTREGVMTRIQEFIISSNQVRLRLIHFLALLIESYSQPMWSKVLTSVSSYCTLVGAASPTTIFPGENIWRGGSLRRGKRSGNSLATT